MLVVIFVMIESSMQLLKEVPRDMSQLQDPVQDLHAQHRFPRKHPPLLEIGLLLHSNPEGLPDANLCPPPQPAVDRVPEDIRFHGVCHSV